jgi:hypothetical protein
MKPFRTLLRAILVLHVLLLFFGLTTACASIGKPKKLGFSEVEVSSDPSPPKANHPAKLIVTLSNKAYAEREGDVQLQLNSMNSLPQLVQAKREQETYVADVDFSQAEEYTVTVHLYYTDSDEHYEFAKKLKVQQ